MIFVWEYIYKGSNLRSQMWVAVNVMTFAWDYIEKGQVETCLWLAH